MTEATPVAMEVWKAACNASQEAFYAADGMFSNDPEAIQQGRHADHAAAAVIATALADMQRRVEQLTQQRDGARKAMDLFMSAPGMPPHVLQWVQFQMSRQALSDKTKDKNDG